MTSTLEPDYRRMLNTPAPLKGQRKDTIVALQKQIDFHIAEAHRLRYAQNSHVAISRLPAELLSDVFLYVVETGLRKEDTAFAAGTFAFLRVCKRWNEIAVGFPQLWVWLISGALKAWDLFKSRSKDAPLFLTWRSRLLDFVPSILINTEIPSRIRQLDFNGTREELEHILGAFHPRSTSATSSIRLQCLRSNNHKGEYLTRFFFFSFPKLSKLDIGTSLPDSTSSILTTSNLTSLKLNPPINDSHRYTRSQFLQVLQQHPNLKQLDLSAGGLSLAENSGELVPVLLPCLVDLRFCGGDEVIEGFIDLVSMSSPLHNVIIDFQPNHGPVVAAHVNTAKKLLTVYYGCKELEHPRKATHLIASSCMSGSELKVDAKSHSASASDPIYNLRLQFHGVGTALAQKIIPLFPLKHVREYDISQLDLSTDDCRRTLRRMDGLLCLRLGNMDTGPVLNALDLIDEAKLDQPITPKLESLSFHYLDLFFDSQNKLLDILKERLTHGVGLKSLAIRMCNVHTLECEEELEDLVREVIWENVGEIHSEYDTESEETDLEDEYYDYSFGYGRDYWI